MAGSASKRAYHHGNLRADLLRAAADEIAKVGTAGLSLRGLARRAGVSHAAPAHHFVDKRGLFTALAAEGFHLLHQRTEAMLGRPDALVRTGECYVAFALEHPAHFEVMFNASLLDPDDEALIKERDTTFEVLYRALQTGTGVDDDEELAAQTLAAWVLVHGFATLWLTGNLPYPPDPAQVTRMFREVGPALLPVVQTSLDQLGSPAEQWPREGSVRRRPAGRRDRRPGA